MELQHKEMNATHSWASHYSIACPLGTIDIVLGQMLEVTDTPEGLTWTETDKLASQFVMSSAKIQWLREVQGLPGWEGWKIKWWNC